MYLRFGEMNMGFKENIQKEQKFTSDDDSNNDEREVSESSKKNKTENQK